MPAHKQATEMLQYARDAAELLLEIRIRCAKDHSLAAKVHQAATDGLMDCVATCSKRATDMETLLAFSLGGYLRKNEGFVRETLAKWEGKTNLNWRRLLDAIFPPDKKDKK